MFGIVQIQEVVSKVEVFNPSAEPWLVTPSSVISGHLRSCIDGEDLIKNIHKYVFVLSKNSTK